MTHRRVAIWTSAAVGLAIVAAGASLTARFTRTTVAPLVTTAAAVRGNVVVTVQATGALETVSTVDVGSQVSGRLSAVYADFNSLVRAGQVLARLDPSLFEARVAQAEASVVKAEADLEGRKLAVTSAQRILDRNAPLAAKHLISPAELQTAQVALRVAKTQARSAEASLTLARASLRQAQVNLKRTVITSPIDGLVLSRDVDAGQTVAASVQAPTLFVLAADLGHLRLSTGIDESDVGRVRVGQPATFTVDAYPDDTFAGRVEQVRLEPTVDQNVVTYTTVIGVDNPDLKLRPGMTAIVTIEVARRDDVLAVPTAALRFRLTDAALEALGEAAPVVPPEPARAGATVAGERGRATLWRYENGSLASVSTITGLSSATLTEIIGGSVAAGDTFVTAVRAPARADTSLGASIAPANPFLRGRSRRWR